MRQPPNQRTVYCRYSVFVVLIAVGTQGCGKPDQDEGIVASPKREARSQVVAGDANSILLSNGIEAAVFSVDNEALTAKFKLEGLPLDMTRVDGQQLVAVSSNVREIRLVDCQTTKTVCEIPIAHQFNIVGAVVDSSNRRLLTMGVDLRPNVGARSGPGYFKSWNIGTKQESIISTLGGWPMSLARSHDGQVVAIGDQRGEIQTFKRDPDSGGGWDVSSMFRLGGSGAQAELLRVAISSKGKWIAAYGGVELNVWQRNKPRTRVVAKTFEVIDSIRDACFCGDNRFVIALKNELAVWDLSVLPPKESRIRTDAYESMLAGVSHDRRIVMVAYKKERDLFGLVDLETAEIRPISFP